MRWLIIFAECLFVFVFIPMIGVNVLDSRANALVQHGDILLGANPSGAIKLYQKADALHVGRFPDAVNRISVCKAYGIGTNVDDGGYVSRTNSLFMSAKSSYFLQALGRMPRLDSEMERKLWDDSKHLACLRESLVVRITALANEDVLWAQKELASCCLEGVGVAQNARKAFKWYLRAAEGGNVEAMFLLGACYCDGEGVIADAKEGFGWIETAANRGHVVAQRMVGWCYENGVGVEADLYQAFKWYKKAADNGDLPAKEGASRCSLFDRSWSGQERSRSYQRY